MKTGHLSDVASSHRCRQTPELLRQGIVIPLAAVLMLVMLIFIALAVDTSKLVVIRTEMQNAADASALAAAQEMIRVLHEAAETGAPLSTTNSITRARAVAVEVGAANGMYIDPARDVAFGHRVHDASTDRPSITWGATPYNVVKVTAQRIGGNPSPESREVPLSFGWAVGRPTSPLTVEAIASIPERDIVYTLDLSLSMHCDSRLHTDGDSLLSLAQRETHLDLLWSAMRAADPKWPGMTVSKFPAAGWGRINTARGVYVRNTGLTTVPKATADQYAAPILHPEPVDYGAVQDYYDLDIWQWDNNYVPLKPFPQSGRNAAGRYNPRTDFASSFLGWYRYIQYVRNHPDPAYRSYYGYRSLMDYLQKAKPERHLSEDLWRTPMQPIEAVKSGSRQFATDLEQLAFGDRMGLVTYDGDARAVDRINDDDTQFTFPTPLTTNFGQMRTLLTRRQPGEISWSTNIGRGLEESNKMLFGTGGGAVPARKHAVPMVLLMTDGRPNDHSGWTMPGDFDWTAATDFDGDGTPNYATANVGAQHTIFRAYQLARQGAVIHTLAVGSGADVELLQAVARIGGGECHIVPGGMTAAQTNTLTTTAFRRFASRVPPPKLIHDFAE